MIERFKKKIPLASRKLFLRFSEISNERLELSQSSFFCRFGICKPEKKTFHNIRCSKNYRETSILENRPNQSINQPLTHSIEHSINQSIKHSLTQSIKHSLNQSIKHSFVSDIPFAKALHVRFHAEYLRTPAKESKNRTKRSMKKTHEHFDYALSQSQAETFFFDKTEFGCVI